MKEEDRIFEQLKGFTQGDSKDPSRVETKDIQIRIGTSVDQKNAVILFDAKTEILSFTPDQLKHLIDGLQRISIILNK